MKVTVLGGTGTLGGRVAERLAARGHKVVAASRATGVDAVEGRKLKRAMRRADVVVDCLNVGTASGRRAVDFFTRSATQVTAAAERAEAGRIVVVSIHGAADPEVSRLMGYYRGKAAQERIYGTARVPVTLVRSTQWFELLPALAGRTGLGPFAVPPSMRMAPVAVDRVAALVVREVEAPGEEDRVLAIRGPEEATAEEMLRTLLRYREVFPERLPRFILPVPYLGRAIAGGALIPEDGVVDTVTLEDWVRGSPAR